MRELVGVPACGFGGNWSRIVADYCWWRAPPYQSQIGCAAPVDPHDRLGLCDRHRQELLGPNKEMEACRTPAS